MPTPGIDWNYSGDPSAGDLDEVRFLSEDNDPELPWLTDDEVQWAIDKWGELYGSNTYVASIVAALLSRKVAGLGSVQSDGVSVDLSGLAERFRQVAADLRNEYAAEREFGEVDITNLLLDQNWDYSIRPLNFSIGMHDNIEAGQQDFGGWPSGLVSWPN